ncbi:MAG: AMP-binding protein, partial [Polyangiales bacterium]
MSTRDAAIAASLGDTRVFRADLSLSVIFADVEFDCLFSVANDRVLSAEQLACARVASINYHDGPLPKYAGLRATRWAIVNGERTHGVTWHHMVAGVDAGDVLAQATVPIAPRETTRSLDLKCYARAIATFEIVLDRIDAGDLVGAPQDLRARTYHPARRRIPHGGRLEWTLPATRLDALVRSTHGGSDDDDWGHARLRLPNGRDVVVTETELARGDPAAAPGTVLAIESAGLIVATGEGSLRVTRARDVDGHPLAIDALARAASLVVGAALIAAERDVAPAIVEADDPFASSTALATGEDTLSRFRATARAHPRGIALRTGDGSVTYAELDDRSNRCAARLAAAGVARGDLVAILLEASPDFVATALAVWKCGAAYVPLEIDSPPDRLRQIVDAASPVVAVTTSRFAPRLPETVAHLAIDVRSDVEDAASIAMHTPRSDDLAYVIFTSGSSGAPKGTLVEHGSLARFLS